MKSFLWKYLPVSLANPKASAIENPLLRSPPLLVEITRNENQLGSSYTNHVIVIFY